MKKLIVVLALGVSTFAVAEEPSVLTGICRDAAKIAKTDPDRALQMYQDYEQKRDRLFAKNPELKQHPNFVLQEDICASKKERLMWNVSSPVLEKALKQCETAEQAIEEKQLDTAREHLDLYKEGRDKAVSLYADVIEDVKVRGTVRLCDDLPNKLKQREKELAAARAREAARRKAEQARRVALLKKQNALLEQVQSAKTSCTNKLNAKKLLNEQKFNSELSSLKKAQQKITAAGKGTGFASSFLGQLDSIGGQLAQCQQSLEKQQASLQAEKEKAQLQAQLTAVEEEMKQVNGQCESLMSMSGMPDSLDFYKKAENQINTLMLNPDVSAETKKQLQVHLQTIGSCKEFLAKLAPGVF